MVALNCSDQNIAFVACIKGLFFDAGHAVIVDAHVKLRSELCWCLSFVFDDRPDVWLTYVHDPVWYFVRLVAVHIVLLFVDLSRHVQSGGMCRTQFSALSQEPIDVFNVPPNILELLFQRLTDPLLRTFLFLCQCQIIFSGVPPIGTRFRRIVFVADRIDDRFQILSGFVQQVDILRERDMMRCTCGIQHHGSLIFCESIVLGKLVIGSISAVRRWLIIRRIELNDHLVDLSRDIRGQSLPELYQQ